MSEPLVFKMGEYAATIPTDRSYCRNHMWAQQTDSGAWRLGFSTYAVRLLQDVFFLEWDVDAPSAVRHRQEIGQIESSKAESALYCPLAGTLSAFNESLLSDPSGINVDTYGNGWLFEMTDVEGELLDPDAYVEHLSEAWKLAERTIKGQLH